MHDYYNVVGVSYLRAILTPTRVNRLVTRLNGFPFDQRWLLRRFIFTRKFNWSPVVRVPIPINTHRRLVSRLLRRDVAHDEAYSRR